MNPPRGSVDSATTVADVVRFATILGYHVHEQPARYNGDGFPSLVLALGRLDAPPLFVFVELLREGQLLTHEQRRWGEMLIAAGARWYSFQAPEQLDELERLLVDVATQR